MEAYKVTGDADIVLQSDVFEPLVRQLIIGGLTVTYKRKLDADRASEAALPGIHSAMIDAAVTRGNALLDAELQASRRTGRTALISALSAAELARVAALFGPFVRANTPVPVDFRPGDTAASGLSRAASGLKEDAGYQARVTRIAREPGMIAAVNKAVIIAENYRSDLIALAAVVATGAITAAKAWGNAYATRRGYAPIYADKPT